MKFIAYYRVSTVKQGQSGLGLEAQQNAVAEYLKSNAGELVTEYTEIQSGSKDNRPELQAALRQCRLTGATLLIAKLDRLSRNRSFLMNVQDSSVQFVAVDMPEANHFTVGLMACLADYQPNNTGISLINIGVGPSNAKTITDHISVLRPDAMIMVGHCGGLRNHQRIGDFVLASGYYRDDRVLDDVFPMGNPVIPNYLLNSYLKQALDQHGIEHRIGTVFTTANRNWEFSAKDTVQRIHQSRSVLLIWNQQL